MISKKACCEKKLIALIFVLILCLVPGRATGAVWGISPEIIQGLQWRFIGPTFLGGRVTDVAGVPGDPNIIYVAHAAAGLFKSTNGGTTFEPVFENGGTLSVGAIALSPGNPEIVYIGTGEGKPRNSTSFGDGIYKSPDGGRTWKNMGLTDTERFSRIVVDPRNPDIVFAAAMGHEWGPNKERGVFRSIDGGKSWTNVLYVNETTGASDLCLDPGNPNIIFAGMYDYLRQPWHFRSGGPGGGLYRSSDGGDSWTRLSDPSLANGLPSGPLGRIGVALCAGNPKVVYAMIESGNEGELWRSENRGDTWKAVSAFPEVNARPFYFSNISVDPADANRIYSLNRSMWLSEDGGRNFKEIGYWKIFGDHHALWIDPLNPSRLLNGSDGGFHVSNDRGANWEFINTLPLAQPYHVWVDTADPYNVIGGFQDHEVWRGPNEKWNVRGVKEGDWVRFRSHGDGMYVLADPRDPDIIYYSCELGDITRLDARTGEERYIQPYPVAPSGVGGDRRLFRFNWNSPIHLSPSDPDVLYYGGNVLFKTTDAGNTWSTISPDLTTNDPGKLKLSGGPITPDNSGAEIYCTITAVAESPKDKGLIWAGTDDGNVQLTRDGGGSWTNLAKNIAGLPGRAWVSSICASGHEAGRAYMSVDQHRLDDFSSHVFKTSDYGKTWERISAGLHGYVHIVLEDPREPNLLYAGTELGVFVSFDRGGNWTDLRLGLPRLSVMDLKVYPRANDLIIATHARGFYILDDITPLQKLASALNDKVRLFKPMTATRYTPAGDTTSLSDQVFLARNKPYGALISYYLSESSGPGSDVRIEILGEGGDTLRTFRGPGRRGLNRAVWNLRQDPVAGFSEVQDEMWFNPRVDGPRVLPGTYKVRLTVPGTTVEESFEVRPDPRIRISPEDWAAYGLAVKRLARMQYSVNEALEKIRRVDGQIAGLEGRIADRAIRTRAADLRRELGAIREELKPDPRFPEHLNLDNKILTLRQQVEDCTGKPTRAQSEWMETFDRQLGELLSRLEKAIGTDLGSLNERLREAGIPHVSIGDKLP
ncbi:MAG: WD40/YVTN/BNR-like repeat-containing protein [Candidatus Aminicenantales bacterium]